MSYILSNLTPRGKKALSDAAKLAAEMNHSYIGAEHIYLAVTRLETGLVAAALRQTNAPLKAIELALRKEMCPGCDEIAEEHKAAEKGDKVVDSLRKVESTCYSSPMVTRANEFRHYLLADDSVQWTVKLARIEIDPNISVKSDAFPVPVKEELLDVPTNVDRCDFLGNIYAREAQFGSRRFGGQSYGWWSISEAEYTRIKRLVELTPSVNEFNRLAAYA